MREFSRTGLTVLALVAALGVAGRAEPTANSKVQWQPDLKTAHRIANERNQPILIVFGAEWCTYCHKLERDVLNTPATSAYINQNFVPVHLDLDKDKKAAAILKVESLPCTVVISPKAELITKFNGYLDAEKFQRKLAQSQQTFRATQTAEVPGTARVN